MITKEHFRRQSCHRNTVTATATVTILGHSHRLSMGGLLNMIIKQIWKYKTMISWCILIDRTYNKEDVTLTSHVRACGTLHPMCASAAEHIVE